ncbi:MAG: FtsX-like permease family protein [Verrucomicrobiales bacterium]|nr:FtsX-like permease family protein [Verrucomicrobiales bacterium]
MRWLTALFSRWTWRMAWRDSRASRRRLALFSASISLGIAALVAIGSLGRNLASAIQEQAKSLLGADLVLTSRLPPNAEVLDLVRRIGGESARETSFSTMLVVSNATRLVNARAITGGFPFYGTLETDPPSAAAALTQGGGVLVEEGVLFQFDLKPGDSVRLGNAEFRILGSLRRVPGDSIAFATIAPRVYLSDRDLPATGLLKPGSLARYRFQFRLPADTDVAALVERWRPEFQRLKLESDTVARRQEDLGRSLENLYRFLNLVALVALLLGAVGIASAVHTHVQQKLANVAVLRCLGATLPATFGIYLSQGLLLGALGTGMGIALGAVAAAQLPKLVQSFIPFALHAAFDWRGALVAAVIGFGLCFLFVLLPLLSVRRVSPLAAIRAAYGPPSRRDPAQLAILALIAAAVTAFALFQTRRWTEGLGVAGGLAAAFAILAASGRGLMWVARRFTPASFPYPWRQGLANLHRPHNRTTMLLVALGLGTFLLLTLQMTRDVLLRQLFPDDRPQRPNAILFDIQPDQQAGVANLLRGLGLPVLDEAPIITMRLAEVKGVRTELLVGDPKSSPVEGPGRRDRKETPEWILRREYRSSWRTNLNDSEQLVAGQWIPSIPAPPDGSAESAPIPISMEEGIARDLHVGVGDRLVWDVQGVPVPSVIASLRKVDWRQVRPNFFVLFPAGSLEAAPSMLLLATRVRTPEESARMQRELVRAFPNVSAIDLTLILETLDGVLTRIGFVIRFMALFTVATGLLVLAGAVLSGRWQRIQEGILLRTLGATRAQIRGILVAEFTALGLLSGVLASILAIAASWALARFAFDSDYVLAWRAIVLAIPGVTALTLLVGLLSNRGIATHPPLEILRKEG